jgi:hypothetical protein
MRVDGRSVAPTVAGSATAVSDQHWSSPGRRPEFKRYAFQACLIDRSSISPL